MVAAQAWVERRDSARPPRWGGPHDPTKNAGEEKRAKSHAARASDERPEHPSDREEAGREDGLSTVTGEQPFDLLQAFRGDLHVASPLQDERSTPSEARPVPDLVADDGPKDSKRYDESELQVALLDKDACGEEDGRARERDARAPEHHAEEDD